MGIVLGDNIDYKGKKPLDSRMLFDTIADMKAYSENYLPDITLAFNKEDSKMYVFNRENDVDEDTGKWRIFDSVSGEEDKANIIDGTEIKDLFGGTEEDIKIKTITDEIENDKAPLHNNELAYRANVGYFTPVDQVGIQGKNIYSINLWDGRAGDIGVYAVNVGVTSGILTLKQFPANLSAYEAASSKICTLHLLGDGQHRKFVLDGTDSKVTYINEDFVNEAGYVEISTGYFLSFKDYSASGTGGPLYGGVEGMGREVGFCYIDGNATRQFLPSNLAVGVSTVTETEGTGTAYAFDTYLRDEENNTLRSKEIEEAKKSVDNLFNVETVSTVKIGPGVDQASFTSRNQAYDQTNKSGPFVMYDQRGIQGKKLYSIGIGCNTNTKGGAIDIYIAHLNNTGEVLTKASFPTNVEDFLPLCERLCTVTFPTNDGNKFYTFKLDGTDSRVSNINSNYVGDDGYIEIPVGYYIGLKTWNTNNAPAFTYSGTINSNNPYSIGWGYYISDGTTGTITENATAMLGLQFNIIEGAEQKHYNFDDKLVTTIKHEEHIDFAPACETSGTRGLSAVNYYLGNRIFFPMGKHNIEQYSMNGKYLRGISYVGVANTPVYFVLAHVEDNSIDYNGTTNSDCYAISTGTPENNYNGKALFKITPDANVDTSKPTIYKLDGTDSRVTILNTDLYDSEEGGFLFDKTWLVGINCMGFTNTNNTTPDGTYPARYLRTSGYGFLSYNTTTPSKSATFGKDSNNSLMLTFYTDVDEITYEEQINSQVIADLKEKVDNIDMTEVESPLKGKYISLIGDSISTYQGWSNVPPLSTSAAVYYPRGDVSNVNYTYWKMLVDRTGANLLVNNSWSGSTLCSQGTAPVIGTGANDRCHQLDKDGHLPDYIIINIGTNDFDRSFGLGTWNGRGEDFPANASTATATTFREAYAIMLARLQEYYPLAKIYCCTFPCGNRLARGINERNTNGVYLVEFNDAIREIATAFGCRVIDLASSGLNYRTLQTLFCDYNSSSQGGEGDALHPNIAGMERFYELIRGAMESESSNTSAATRKKLVDLRDVNITSPVTGQGIIYDAVTGKWINGKAGDAYQNCITFWGDSLTADGGWTTRLASLAGMTERNGGTGGENARTIVARQGADVMMINNKTIPASGAVTLYTRSADVGIPTQEGYKVTPLLQGGSHVNPVKIGDITGTLAWTGSSYADQNGTWTFTRSTAGEAVTIDRPTAMTTNFDRTYNNPHLMVIFIGQNGGYSDLDDLVRQHRLMIDHAKAKHYIVLGLSSGSAEQRADYETRMKKEFGRYFISLREYLSTPIYENGNIVSCYGMADQNVAVDPEFTYDGKTTLQEIAAGICPHQILADSVHYTSGTKTVIGDYLYKKCKELGIF